MTNFHGKHLPQDIPKLSREQLIELCKIQFEQNAVLALEFERALDVAEDCAVARTKEEACKILEKFISETSFEQSQELLAQRDLATREDECYVIVNLIKQDMYLSKEVHDLIAARVKQLKNGGEL